MSNWPIDPCCYLPDAESGEEQTPDPILTRAQVRAVDQRAIEELGIPGVVLMENAGINATALLLDVLADDLLLAASEATIRVICGGGNNGGDGYVIARHLHNWGATVAIDAFKPIDELKGDALTNARICQQMKLPIREVPAGADLSPLQAEWEQADMLVDALLGTGFHGHVREGLTGAIAAINGVQDTPVLSVDVPSGFDCEKGGPSDATVQADLTVTFVAKKTGFDKPDNAECLGRLIVAEIGVPPELVADVAASGD